MANMIEKAEDYVSSAATSIEMFCVTSSVNFSR